MLSQACPLVRGSSGTGEQYFSQPFLSWHSRASTSERRGLADWVQDIGGSRAVSVAPLFQLGYSTTSKACRSFLEAGKGRTLVRGRSLQAVLNGLLVVNRIESFDSRSFQGS